MRQGMPSLITDEELEALYGMGEQPEMLHKVRMSMGVWVWVWGCLGEIRCGCVQRKKVINPDRTRAGIIVILLSILT
jgi:hypothetical protein